MQFVTVIIATMAAVAAASPYPDAFEKRTCVGSEFNPEKSRLKTWIADYLDRL